MSNLREGVKQFFMSDLKYFMSFKGGQKLLTEFTDSYLSILHEFHLDRIARQCNEKWAITLTLEF
jgi:hypothetical protein